MKHVNIFIYFKHYTFCLKLVTFNKNEYPNKQVKINLIKQYFTIAFTILENSCFHIIL